MRCESCGRSLPDDARFCANCGASVRGRSRADELVEPARTGGLVGSGDAAGVPEIPERAELPPPKGELGADVPDIPEPAPLPGGEGAAPTPAEALGVVRPPAPDDLARVRREAAATIVEGIDSALAGPPTVAVRPAGREAETGRPQLLPPPPPAPPPPPPEERARHEGMGALVLEAERRARAERPESPQEEQVEIEGSRCCAVGCIALAVTILVLLLIGLLVQRAEEGPPPSARATPAIERQVGWGPATPHDVTAGTHPDLRGLPRIEDVEERTTSPRHSDGRMGRDVLHQLRKATG